MADVTDQYGTVCDETQLGCDNTCFSYFNHVDANGYCNTDGCGPDTVDTPPCYICCLPGACEGHCDNVYASNGNNIKDGPAGGQCYYDVGYGCGKDATGTTGGSCYDSNACGSDLYGCLYKYGYGCGLDCAGRTVSADLLQYGGAHVDNNGNTCQDVSADAFGYCCGDAQQDCAGNWYSPSNEDGNTHYSPSDCQYVYPSVGCSCSNSTYVDCLGYCCGVGHDGDLCTCNQTNLDSVCCDNIEGATACDRFIDNNTYQWKCLYDYGQGCGIDCNGNPIAQDPYIDPNGTVCYSGSKDHYGYCCGGCDNNGLTCGEDSGGCLYWSCSGNCDSYTNNGFYGVYEVYHDNNDTCCDIFSVDGAGYCNGTCAGNLWSPAAGACGEDQNGCLYTNCDGSCTSSVANPSCPDCAGNTINNPYTDGNGVTCDSSSQDGLGYCCGDAINYGCGFTYCSPSGENGYSSKCQTDVSGNQCTGNDFDNFSFCCGSCFDFSACGSDGNCLYTACDGSCSVSSPQTCNDCAGSTINNPYTDGNGVTCDSSSQDGLGYCCGDAVLGCGGVQPYYSPSCEDGSNCKWTDPNGTVCNTQSTDDQGYCCGPCWDLSACGEDQNGCLYTNCDGSCTSPDANPRCASIDCTGNPINNSYTDPNGVLCDSSSQDYFGYCCGDGGYTDCAGNNYSPSNENGYTTTTDPNGNKCNNGGYDGYNSLDVQGYCCGNCNDYSACGEDEYGCLYLDSCGNCGTGCTGNVCDCGCASYDCAGVCGGSKTTDVCGNCVDVPVIIPSQTDVALGVVYGCGGDHTGSLIVTTTTTSIKPNGINIGQLIGLPSFIQLN